MTIADRLSHGLCEAEVAALCAEAVADDVLSMQLYRLIYFVDKRVASNAAWVLTRMPLVSVAFMQQFQNDIIDLSMGEKDSVTLRRLTLNILNRQSFEADTLRADFLDYCLATMMDVSEPPGLRSLCIKLAYRQCSLFPELLTEYMYYADLIRQQPMQPAIRSAINNTLKAINKKRP